LKTKSSRIRGEDISKLTPAFETPINPESFSKNLKIDVDIRRQHGGRGTDVRFKSTAPEELKVDFVLDGTGLMEGYKFDNYVSRQNEGKVDQESLKVCVGTRSARQVSQLRL